MTRTRLYQVSRVEPDFGGLISRFSRCLPMSSAFDFPPWTPHHIRIAFCATLRTAGCYRRIRSLSAAEAQRLVPHRNAA